MPLIGSNSKGSKVDGQKPEKTAALKPSQLPMAEVAGRVSSNTSMSSRSNDGKNSRVVFPKVPDGQWMAVRIFLGVGICFGSFQAPWQALPVLIDSKIAADEGIPLTENQMVLAQTAVYVGWFGGSFLLHPLMQRLDMRQLLVLMAGTMVLLSVGTVTLPYIQALSLTMLCMVRLLHGICLNIQGLQIVHITNTFPSRGSQLCCVTNGLYSAVAAMMSLICGSLTLETDWRLEALLWFGLPMSIGLLLAFPDLWSILKSLPSALTSKVTVVTSLEDGGKKQGVSLPREMHKDLVNLAVCFAATVYAYYGLSYSAHSLSSNPYGTSILLHGSDVVAYILASNTQWDRNRSQFGGFLLCGICLIACAAGASQPLFVLTMAMVARMSLSVVFVTIYIALAELFPEWCQKIALPVCEIFGRAGGCLSPWCGSLPCHRSLPLFGLACLVAARATSKLPNTARKNI